MISRRRGQPAVFVDRDGVLNQAVIQDGVPHPPPIVAELRILDGVPEACLRLKAAGLAVIVVTNQPDIARGRQTLDEVTAIHEHLRKQVALDAIYMCPHDDGDRCGCRKPAPGLLVAAADEHDLDLSSSFMVGDRWRDIEAGVRAGCRTVFVDHGYDERRPEGADLTVPSLWEAVEWIETVAQSDNARWQERTRD